jgi:pimeloyl-ACP methyl ester carboxylesterase
MHEPERLHRLAILNVPHPSAFQRALATTPRQWLRSWYALSFQLPALPEWVLRRNHWQAMAHSLQRSSRPGAFTEDDLVRYREAWVQPGALTAMLDWYRAALRHPARARRGPRIVTPTLILWGIHDVALEPSLAAASAARCADVRLVRFEDATHWLHLEEPARVNDLLLGFLEGGTAAVDAGTGTAGAKAPYA